VNDRPLPMPTDATSFYWESARAGKLVIQKCGACGKPQFYPRPFCLSCLSEEVGWIEASGNGTIYTFTVNRRPANEFMKDKVPYVVAAIDLDEGVRMVANIVGSDPGVVKCGARVRVTFEKASEEITLPQFVLAT
jgi:uncharacterized OB-fold protein